MPPQPINRLPADSPRSDADVIRARMARLRGELNHEVETAKAEASQLLDWRSYVAAHPLTCVGVAAVAGYLLAPQSQRVLQLSDKQVRELAKIGGINVTAETAATEKTSFASTALTAIGAIAGRAALGYASRLMADQLGPTGHNTTASGGPESA